MPIRDLSLLGMGRGEWVTGFPAPDSGPEIQLAAQYDLMTCTNEYCANRFREVFATFPDKD